MKALQATYRSWRGLAGQGLAIVGNEIDGPGVALVLAFEVDDDPAEVLAVSGPAPCASAGRLVAHALEGVPLDFGAKSAGRIPSIFSVRPGFS